MMLRRSRSGVPWLLWGISLGAMLGWPGWVGCAFGAIACRFTVDDTWALLGDGEMFRVLRRRGRSAWTLAAMVGPGVGLSRKGNTVVLRGGEGSARLHLESASEARGMERRLRSTVEGRGAARGSARTVDLETRAPWAEWAWLGGALAATLILAHVRGLPAGLVVVLPVYLLWARVSKGRGRG